VLLSTLLLAVVYAAYRKKGKKTKHAHKNMEINGNTTNKHKLETA
jgi:cbb3-type cytochrome oxidase subunit 3